MAKVKVGGPTETEMDDKKLRYNDAINAVRSAKEMGIVPGGGSALTYLASSDLLASVSQQLETDDERIGARLVFESLVAPMRQIAKNAGEDPSEVLFMVRGKGLGFGYNVATRSYENLLESGVVDPAKVVINAVTNAASIAGMVLTTDVVVTDAPVTSAPVGASPGSGFPGMGGMGGGGGMF